MKHNPYDGIIANLFVGDNFAANHHGKQFELLVNCAFGLECPRDHPKCFHLPIHQSEKETKNYFDMILSTGILDRIHELVSNGKPVLIYCLQGMHRSCTLCACYLMKYYDFTVNEVVSFMRSKRSIAFNPVYNLKNTMILFYQHMHPHGSKRDNNIIYVPEPNLPYFE